MGRLDTEHFGEQVAALLRGGSRAQYDEVQKFVLEAVRGDHIDGKMIMEIISSPLPKTAQKKISTAMSATGLHAGPCRSRGTWCNDDRDLGDGGMTRSGWERSAEAGGTSPHA